MMVPTKRCYKHPRFMDVFIEVLGEYKTGDGVKLKIMWWNKGSYYGLKPFPLFSRPKKIRLKASKWREFERINWIKECNI